MSRPKPWTPGENRAVCSLYAAMRAIEDQAAGAKYKAAMIRIAQGKATTKDRDGWGGDDADYAGKLADRSKGSIEAKLMNITAALDGLKLYRYSMAEHGYRPLSNVQASLVEAVKARFGRDAVRRVLS